MDPVEEIERAQAMALVSEDGDEIVLERAPPLSEVEIEQHEAEVGVTFPDDLRSLLRHTSGIGGTLETIDFTGRSLDVELSDMFPFGLPIAHDGYGNHWVLDLTPDETSAAPVFFACHDAPVVLYQSPDLGHFLHEVFRMSIPPHSSLVDDVHEDRLFEVWRTNPAEIDRAAALAGDTKLRAFADELDERFVFADLRSPEIGMGFSWGRFGPRTEVRRHGYERIFAYARQEREPGLLRRLFG